MSRISKVVSAIGLGASLALGSVSATAGMIGTTVHARFYGLDSTTVDSDAGIFAVTDGYTCTFQDDIGFGTCMQVTFHDTQIVLTNLIPGVYPAYTAADFEFLSGPAIKSATVDAASSPLFAPGSVTTTSAHNITTVLNGTCYVCTGGESIILDVGTVAAVPEPASVALFASGLLAVAWRRRRAG